MVCLPTTHMVHKNDDDWSELGYAARAADIELRETVLFRRPYDSAKENSDVA
jgi:hypothetical protein